MSGANNLQAQIDILRKWCNSLQNALRQKGIEITSIDFNKLMDEAKKEK